MPYSELSNWDGSLDDSRSVAAPSVFPSPQREREPSNSITAERCARRIDDDVHEGAGVEGEFRDSTGGFAFVQNVRACVSRAMGGGSTQRRAHSNAKHSSAGEVLKEIVVTPYKRPTHGPVGEEDITSSSHEKAGLSSAVAQKYTPVKSRSVTRTYAGPRKIKGISTSSELNKTPSSRPGGNGLRVSEGHAVSDADTSADPLLLGGTGSGSPSGEGVTKHGASGSSSNPVSVDGSPAKSTTSTLQRRNRDDDSKNSFYASLSNVINGQRRDALERAVLLDKPLSKRNTQSPQSVSVMSKRPTASRTVFYGVVIPSRPLPVPKEMYKSIDEYLAEEETELRLRKEKRKSKERGRGKSHDRRELVEEPSKRKPAIQEAIYVSSSSEGPVAGPSRKTVPARPRSPIDLVEYKSNDAGLLKVDSNSDDEYLPLSRAPRKKRSITPTKSLLKPKPKRRKRQRAGTIILSSESSSDSEAVQSDALLVHGVTRPLRSVSPDLVQAPMSEAPESASEQRKAEGLRSTNILNSLSPELQKMSSIPAPEQRTAGMISDRTAEASLEGVDAALDSEDQVEAAISPGFVPEDSIPSPSEEQKDDLVTTSGLHEIVVSSRPVTAERRDDAGHPRSPTLCLSSDLSRLTTPSPSSRSTTLAVQETPLDPASKAVDTGMKREKVTVQAKAKSAAVLEEDDTSRLPDVYEVKDEESSSDEEDDVCHQCRSRNVYAKMKCTKMKKNGVCQLLFCHRCIVVHFPKVEFDPYSGTFVCPACDGTCVCSSCCKKRGVPPIPQPRGLKWSDLGVTLFLSPQETHRQEKQKMRLATGRPDPSNRVVTSKRGRGAKERKLEKATDIGKEAEAWIRERQRSSGNRTIRAFVGAWQDSWGPTPAKICEMDCVDLDVHAVNGTGKGKGKAVAPETRLFIGDERALHRPFLRADEVVLSGPSSPKKRPGRRRKRAEADTDTAAVNEAIYVVPAEIPMKKRRRLANSITIPEFTINHQDCVSSSATSSFHHPTPDDLSCIPGLDSKPFDPHPYAHLRYPGIVNDPMLGVLDGGFNSDSLGLDSSSLDWDSFTMKPLADSSLSEPDFSYQGTYDAYAAALGGTGGLGQYDHIFQCAPVDHDPNVGIAKADEGDFTQLVDPSLIEQGQAEKTTVEPHLNSDPDPTRFLTPHARASMLMSAPMINGVPSSTGLSLQDLERAVRASLNTISTQVCV